jgi:predicted O-methyltransferase YrrM
MLKIGWKNWDKYLQPFNKKKNTMIELGSYKGEATCKLLTHLATHPKSLVFAVDTWEGSPEYSTTMSFQSIEMEFDSNIEKTGKKDQLIKMKMTTEEALLKLNIEKKYKFDIVFIDASHTAGDVLRDAILIWPLVNPDGVIIFDDYRWEKLNKEYFRPKLAIDSFISIFAHQLDVLALEYQAFIKKRDENKYEKPVSTEMIKHIEMLKNIDYEFEPLILNGFLEDELKFKIKYEDFPKEDKTLEYVNHVWSIYYNITDNILLPIYEDVKFKEIIIEILKKHIKKHNYQLNDIIDVFFTGSNRIRTLKTHKILLNECNHSFDKYDKINMLNLFYFDDVINKSILDEKPIVNSTLNTIKTMYGNLSEKLKFDLSLYIYYVSTNLNKPNIKQKYLNKENLIQNPDKIMENDKKYDIIPISLFCNLEDNINNKKAKYQISFFYTILFVLWHSNINAIAAIHFNNVDTTFCIDCLWILKHYFKDIRIDYRVNRIYAVQFLGIKHDEFMELKKIGDMIHKQNPDYCYPNKYMASILTISDKNTDYHKFYNTIIKHSNKYRQYIREKIKFDKETKRLMNERPDHEIDILQQELISYFIKTTIIEILNLQ